MSTAQSFYTISEPRPEGRGMIWKGLRTPPKCSFELPGPKGPGFPFLDEQGWRQYDVEKLLAKQCPIAEKSCIKEAAYERYKAIGISSGAVLGAGAIVYAAMAIAKAAPKNLYKSSHCIVR